MVQWNIFLFESAAVNLKTLLPTILSVLYIGMYHQSTSIRRWNTDDNLFTKSRVNTTLLSQFLDIPKACLVICLAVPGTVKKVPFLLQMFDQECKQCFIKFSMSKDWAPVVQYHLGLIFRFVSRQSVYLMSKWAELVLRNPKGRILYIL